jgi:hypothetical protein
VAPVTTSDGSSRAAGTPGLPSVISARSWLVTDADTGAVLATRDPHTPMPPASTLKLLTALALRPVLPADGWAVPSAQAVGITGSKAHLDQGARYRISDLLRTMLIISANDAAETLADAAGGDARAVSLMKTEARHLGANDTVPVDPTGLDAPDQHSSAYDLGLIGRAVLRDPVLAGIVGSAHSSFTGSHGQTVPLTNHNKLLTDYPGGIGLKTGFLRGRGPTWGAHDLDRAAARAGKPLAGGTGAARLGIPGRRGGHRASGADAGGAETRPAGCRCSRPAPDRRGPGQKVLPLRTSRYGNRYRGRRHAAGHRLHRAQRTPSPSR